MSKYELTLINDFHVEFIRYLYIYCRVEVFFVRADGTKIRATGKAGDSLLDVVVNNSIDLEGFGACEGTLTCSTCHLIFKQEDFDKLPGKMSNNAQVKTISNLVSSYHFLFLNRKSR